MTPGTYVPEESGDTGRLAAVLPLKDGRVALALLSVETDGLVFVLATLGITKWAAKRTRSASNFYTTK